MTVILCPPPDDEPWPTLGLYVADWIEDNLCHGPGDLLGKPVTLTEEVRAWLAKMYELEPPILETRRGKVISRSANPRAGRRRFQRCALSLRKGSSKTEIAAWIAAAELHPDGPVRCAGFEKDGTPIPMGVTDPYIPMIAYTEEQSEELAYGALRRILLDDGCRVGHDFDIALERILRLSGNGKAEAVSATPNARDGARTTFQHADETHRFTSDTLRRAWTVMLANLAKRPMADPWALETTTAPEPGAQSVAENTMEYARQILKQDKASASRLFFYHREASEALDINEPKQLRTAIAEASGPYILKWTDVERIAGTFEEPGADRPYLERVWLNRLVQSSGRAFDIEVWRKLARPDFRVPEGSAITIGFDGSRFQDATSAVATHLESGFQWPLGIWEKPLHLPEWEVPRDEVDGVVSDAFARYHVCRMYCDPPKWEGVIAEWSGRWEGRVAEWWTNRRKQMAYAIRAYVTAMATGDVSHDGDKQLEDHVANARRDNTGLVDEEGKPLWILRKERPDSPKKIDAAMAACLSWEARTDAIAAGEGAAPEPTLFFLGYGG